MRFRRLGSLLVVGAVCVVGVVGCGGRSSSALSFADAAEGICTPEPEGPFESDFLGPDAIRAEARRELRSNRALLARLEDARLPSGDRREDAQVILRFVRRSTEELERQVASGSLDSPDTPPGQSVAFIRAGQRLEVSCLRTDPTRRPSPEEPSTPTPAEVRGGTRAAFVRGRKVLAQSGCLACHQIGAAGNDGPGPSLARIGHRLSGRSLARVLRDPEAPMPSFEKLPKGKFDDLVVYLRNLR